MAHDEGWRPGSEIERADAFEIAFCGNPECGLHLVALRKDGSPICEVVMSATKTLALIGVCKDNLYEKAVKRS